MRVNEPLVKREFSQTDYEKLDVCPWCNSNESEQWGEDNEPFNTAMCRGCGLVYVNHRLNANGRDKYYRNYYSEEHQAVPEAKVRSKMYQLEFDFIFNYIQTGKVLDVGCSGGEFLTYFQDSGLDCYGVELAKDASQIAQLKFGNKIINKSLLDADFNEEFDLIVFRGTVEHIPDAKETLVKAVSLLKKKQKAYIYITSTPNIESVSAEIFKTYWTQHLPEEHIYHFKKKHFDDLFSEHGLTGLASQYFYEETPYAEVEEDILKVAEAIKLKRANKEITFKSPPFYGNMMSLVYCTESIKYSWPCR